MYVDPRLEEICPYTDNFLEEDGEYYYFCKLNEPLRCNEIQDCMTKRYVKEKQINEQLRTSLGYANEIATLWTENEHYLEENKKLKEKLQEIRNIVLPWYENEWSCYRCRIEMNKKLKKILQIVRD